MPRCGILEFGHSGGSPLECAGLTALCLPAASTQTPTADASKNSQQAFQVRFEDKSLRNVRFKNVANFSVVVWGCRQAAANESAVKPAHSKEVAIAGCGYQKCPNSPAPCFSAGLTNENVARCFVNVMWTYQSCFLAARPQIGEFIKLPFGLVAILYLLPFPLVAQFGTVIIERKPAQAQSRQELDAYLDMIESHEPEKT